MPLVVTHLPSAECHGPDRTLGRRLWRERPQLSVQAAAPAAAALFTPDIARSFFTCTALAPHPVTTQSSRTGLRRTCHAQRPDPRPGDPRVRIVTPRSQHGPWNACHLRNPCDMRHPSHRRHPSYQGHARHPWYASHRRHPCHPRHASHPRHQGHRRNASDPGHQGDPRHASHLRYASHRRLSASDAVRQAPASRCRGAVVPAICCHAAGAPRYGRQSGSASEKCASNRQCGPCGTLGTTRSRQPSSLSSRSALRWLQRAQQATQFSHECGPPRLRGTTWSIVSARSPQ
jgi:hypothetical protein